MVKVYFLAFNKLHKSMQAWERTMKTYGYGWRALVMFMKRFLLFVAFLNASVTIILGCWRIAFYLYSFLLFVFLTCFVDIFKWKFLNFTVEKSQTWPLTWGQKVVRVGVGRSPYHSLWKSRENPTDNTSAQEGRPRPMAYSCTRARTIPTLHNTALHYGPSETVHWGIFYLWTCKILWATGCNCIHRQYKWLLEACTNGNFACSVWVVTHFYSLRSGTAGKTTDPFLLGTLKSTLYLWAFFIIIIFLEYPCH